MTNPIAVNVDTNMTVSGNFAIDTYTLTYAAGTNGSISGTTPQTVNYGSDGGAVTAVANIGFHFVDWSDGSTANPRTDVNVTGNISVTANFTINTYTLTYYAGANGSIIGTSPQIVNHGSDGTSVTAVQNIGYHFVNWSDASIINPRTDVNVTGNNSVTANFAINQYTLIVMSDHGTILKSPNQPTYNYGMVVQITAIPDAGYHFVSWGGDTNGSINPLNITMYSNKTIIASFAMNTYTLTVSATNGTVTKVPNQANYDSGSVVQITGVPTIGYHFVNWTGDITGTKNPDTVMMSKNKTITANFAINT